MELCQRYIEYNNSRFINMDPHVTGIQITESQSRSPVYSLGSIESRSYTMGRRGKVVTIQTTPSLECEKLIQRMCWPEKGDKPTPIRFNIHNIADDKTHEFTITDYFYLSSEQMDSPWGIKLMVAEMHHIAH